MGFNLQKVEWDDEKMQATVYDCNGKFIRVIKYENASEYATCKQLYKTVKERSCK